MDKIPKNTFSILTLEKAFFFYRHCANDFGPRRLMVFTVLEETYYFAVQIYCETYESAAIHGKKLEFGL